MISLIYYSLPLLFRPLSISLFKSCRPTLNLPGPFILPFQLCCDKCMIPTDLQTCKDITYTMSASPCDNSASWWSLSSLQQRLDVMINSPRVEIHCAGDKRRLWPIIFANWDRVTEKMNGCRPQHPTQPWLTNNCVNSSSRRLAWVLQQGWRLLTWRRRRKAFNNKSVKYTRTIPAYTQSFSLVRFRYTNYWNPAIRKTLQTQTI